jgi:hypothetical protein
LAPGAGVGGLPVPITPPTIEITPDGPVGFPSEFPRADLTGIAQEVGKIEQKVLQLLNRPPIEPFDPDTLEILGQILNFLSSVYGPGSYEIQGPCEVGPEGDPPAPLVAAWSGGIGQLDQLEKKVDAIAELLQYHKNLKQPICRRSISGTPVTVLFEEEV